jgi:multicomponent Na+:H+ antiporter subunit E
MIQLFLLNLFLAAVYVVLSDDLSGLNVLFGFVIGAIIVTIYARATGRESYMGKGARLLRFGCYFVSILIRANLQVAWEIVTPSWKMSPRVIRYPIHDLTPAQITTFASAITLTPGTLSADLDEAGQNLYVHCMYAAEREEAVAQLDQLKARLMREVFG